MGIFNRDYYREGRSPLQEGWRLNGLTPAVKVILIANIAVFVLQIFVVREDHTPLLERMRRYNPQLDKRLKRVEEKGPEAVEAYKKKHPELDDRLAEDDLEDLPGQRISIIQEWFELDTDKVIHRGQIWRLLTHAFCHDRFSPWHIFLNMLCLYWFGGTLEAMYGTREFTCFYLTAAVVAALAFIGLDLYTGSRIPAVGASGAVMGVMMLYTMHFPLEEICVFWFFPLQMRWLMMLYVIFELHPLLLALSGDRLWSGIAHAAHLGGLAFGFLYARYEWRLETILDRMTAFAFRWRRTPRLHLVPGEPAEASPDPDSVKIDELLDKILASGEASLTEEEREVLRTASARRKNRSVREPRG